MPFAPPPHFYGGDSVIVGSLVIVAPIVCWGSVFDPCFFFT